MEELEVCGVRCDRTVVRPEQLYGVETEWHIRTGREVRCCRNVNVMMDEQSYEAW